MLQMIAMKKAYDERMKEFQNTEEELEKSLVWQQKVNITDSKTLLPVYGLFRGVKPDIHIKWSSLQLISQSRGPALTLL